MKDLNFFNHYTESKKFKIENIYYLFILEKHYSISISISLKDEDVKDDEKKDEIK